MFRTWTIERFNISVLELSDDSIVHRSVYLDEVSKNKSLTRLVEHSPQLPQGFTPVSGLTFWPGQNLQATCDFNSTEREDKTYAGATHHNEMCNLYMIMWSELPVFMNCQGSWLAADLHGAGNQASFPNHLYLQLQRHLHDICHASMYIKHLLLLRIVCLTQAFWVGEDPQWGKEGFYEIIGSNCSF